MAKAEKIPFYVKRTPNGMRAHALPGSQMPPGIELTFRYAVHSYYFLLKMNEKIEPQEFIARIKRNFSEDNKRVQATINALEIGFALKP